MERAARRHCPGLAAPPLRQPPRSQTLAGLPRAALVSRRSLQWGEAGPSRPGCGNGRGFRVVSPSLPAGVTDPLLWGWGAGPGGRTRRGTAGSETLSYFLCVSLCSKKKHKEKKRKREEDAAEQLDIVGELQELRGSAGIVGEGKS